MGARCFNRSLATLAAVWLGLGSSGLAADLSEIRSRGTIRLLVTSGDDDALLARRGWSPDEDRLLAEGFARHLGARVDWVWVEDEGDLIPALKEGRGDLVADGLTITDERRGEVAFTAPFLYVRHQVVTRADDPELRWRRQLSRRRLAVNPELGHWASAQRLKRAYPKMEIDEVRDPFGTDELLEAVEAGERDVTIATRELMEEYLAAGADLRVAFTVGEEKPVGWAVSREARNLRRAADAFLADAGTWADGDAAFTGDLDEIRERGVLRVLTLNSATTYYMWRGRLAGYEFEMVRELAKALGVHLEIVVPPTFEELGPWLRQGRGDVIAAGVPPSLVASEGMAASTPYREVRGQVVGPADAPALADTAALGGKRIAARPGSPAWNLLGALRGSGTPVELVAASSDEEPEELIDAVAAGRYDFALVSSDLLGTQLAWRDDVRVVLDLGESRPLSWLVREGNPELLAAVDAFLTDPKRAGDRATIARRYFEHTGRTRARGRARVGTDGRISPFDAVAREWSGRYGFDWRLIAAQMYQESAFDPEARSWVGAFGLMQLMPATADQMAIESWRQPEGNVQAGVKYMAWVRDRLQGKLRAEDRDWLTLAAYNAGIGHVGDARHLARERGLDPNRWFGHVEKAMLLKMDPEVYRATRYGYCRCTEPVEYVRRIRSLYRAYTQAVPLDP